MTGPGRVSLLTVVMPVFNEEATVAHAIDRLLNADLPVPIEVIVVDDGSVDGTGEILSSLANVHPIKVVQHSANRGKGAAIRTGMEKATGDLLTVLDADLEYDPQDFRHLLEPILAGERVVYGTRSFGAHSAFSFWYVIGNRLVSLWASFLFNAWLTDVETCFKIAPTELWRTLRLRSRGFGIEPEVTAKLLKAGERIYEAPIGYQARNREAGKKLSWTDGVAALWILLRVRVFGR